ncbi:MAG TPA: NADH:ubiquinone oxidoreductase, Na translocating, B subunit, partial [Spirochaetaceae bacterium]|nr:NADH:ubiquinone oxidoreductase, Na translocating, B subunit [Spirochaetaceae bacterium]
LIRTFSLFPEGTSFALLIGNTFASLFDKIVTDAAKRKQLAARPAAASSAGNGKEASK